MHDPSLVDRLSFARNGEEAAAAVVAEVVLSGVPSGGRRVDGSVVPQTITVN